ncbi:hypothetical protein CROQUDRAFT_650585 [Cronartium quercuum f. sp. fusiforme G11]|uniref:Glutathione S-transferase kappa n=1 Tax=Cronartium quercuum f. sp. fusiforme G11 TaxID=708437 RepID=A0A9P6NXI3_9BASI|nr:hypothetical protein CROQUDRAFT_650585 [Cronartium quercuum f. sp. fusiforme G11]
MASKTIIKLSYDIVSPWSYLAYIVLKRYQAYWNFELVLNPVWLGAVMIAAKNSPPMQVPNKGKHMNEELPLMAEFFKVKYRQPIKFPANTLYAMRLLRILHKAAPDKLESSTERLWEAMFITGKPIEDSDSIKTVLLSDFHPTELDEYIELSKLGQHKASMKQAAEDLVHLGAFGFPWIEITKPNGEKLKIFGSDRFEFLANWLGVKWHGPCLDQDIVKSKM